MARFFRRGVSKIYWAAAVTVDEETDELSATRPQLDDAEDISKHIANINGFQLNNSPIATPDLDDTFTGQIDGEDTTADSSLTLYDDDAVEAIRAAIAKGSEGFLLLLPYGDIPGKRMEIWPAKSTGVNDEWDLGNTAAQYAAGFAISRRPEQEAEVPANP